MLDQNGEIIGYFCADSSMTEITNIKNHYLLIIAAVLIGLALLTGILGVLAVNHFVVRPVKILSAASIEYCQEDDKNEHHKFGELNIRANDEIGDLATSMVQMENDINYHVATLIKEETKKPWRGMSAALGCQVYDRKQHNHFADVFKAADAEMYRDKTAMKAKRQ